MAVTYDDWLQASNSVLGSALLEPDLVPLIIRSTSSADYGGPGRTVFEVMQKLFREGTPVDLISISHALGGEYNDYLKQLMIITPTAANVESYISLTREQSRILSARSIGQRLAECSSMDELHSLIGEADALSADRQRLKISGMKTSLQSFFTRHTGKKDYLDWPIKELNDVIYAEPGDLIILGGYPSAGKSALALQVAWHLAASKKVGFFSLETSAEKLFDRLMASVAGISMDVIKHNALTDEDWAAMTEASTEIARRGLEIIPAAGMRPEDVRAVSVMQQYDVVIIDYLQLLDADGGTRVEQVTNISMALHRMSQSTGITVIALSQLSRPAKDSGKAARPTMGSLRESGQLEQDADLVLLLYLENDAAPQGPRILNIAKNKEGIRAGIKLDFDGAHQSFQKTGSGSYAVNKYRSAGKRVQNARPPASCERPAYEQLPICTPTLFEEVSPQ